MSNALLSSKIVTLEADPRLRSVNSSPTATLAMLGLAERGPMDEATLCTSFEEWRNVFGRPQPWNLETYAAVEGFFAEGGQFLWFSRMAHYDPDPTDRDNITTATGSVTVGTSPTVASSGSSIGTNVEPFILADGQTLSVAIDGNPGVVATFNATPATYVAPTAEPYALADTETLELAVDGGATQTVTFSASSFVDIANATAAEIAAVLNASAVGVSAVSNAGTLEILSDTAGTSSVVDVTGGTAAALGTGTQTGTGNVANILAVTGAEAKTIIEAAVPGSSVSIDAGAVRILSTTTGAASSVQVEAVSTAAGFGFDNAVHIGGTGATATTLEFTGATPGSYTNRLTIVISDSTDGLPEHFNLEVLEEGVSRESFNNLAVNVLDDNYIVDALARDEIGSRLIRASDFSIFPTDALQSRPSNGAYAMGGGDDGLTGLNDLDFIGSSVAQTGLRGLDRTQDITLICCPQRTTSLLQNAMVFYAEVTKQRSALVLLDPPADMNAVEINEYVVNTSLLKGSSEFGAFYWPRVKVINPNRVVYGRTDTVTVPPSGHIAGLIARNDAGAPNGIYLPPAGPVNGRLRNVVGFETTEVRDVTKRDLVYPNRINIIDQEGGVINIDGARTLKADGNFPTVGERRGVIFIQQRIKNLIQFARLQPNNGKLRREVERTIRGFLLEQMALGAFRTEDPETAFFVDVSDALNPPQVIFAGQLKLRVGLATNKPAEFIILEYTQDTRALEQSLLSL